MFENIPIDFIRLPELPEEERQKQWKYPEVSEEGHIKTNPNPPGSITLIIDQKTIMRVDDELYDNEEFNDSKIRELNADSFFFTMTSDFLHKQIEKATVLSTDTELQQLKQIDVYYPYVNPQRFPLMQTSMQAGQPKFYLFGKEVIPTYRIPEDMVLILTTTYVCGYRMVPKIRRAEFILLEPDILLEPETYVIVKHSDVIPKGIDNPLKFSTSLLKLQPNEPTKSSLYPEQNEST